MEQFYLLIFFVLGIILGSFFHLVGVRLGNNESIINPPSHCPYCLTPLKWYELIPVLSYVLQLGSCRHCKNKIPFTSFLTELITGILFATSYHVFGLNIDLLVKLIFVSALMIVIISDIEYMIIPNEVLIVSSTFIIITIFIAHGWELAYASLLSGLFSFIVMFAIKCLGDFMFKKESMGGGDIKLMFLFGLVLNFDTAILSIFVATFLAFPVALIQLIRKKNNMIPFGPFLSMSAIILAVANIRLDMVINFIFG